MALAVVLFTAGRPDQPARAQVPSPAPTSECISPVDISLVFDHSGSMAQFPSGGGSESKLDTAQTAVTGFLDDLAGGDNNLAPNEVGLVGFFGPANNGIATTDSNLTTNASQLKSIINGYNALGFTNIGRAVQLGQNVLAGGTDPDFMILLSDGSANRPGDVTASGAENNLYLDTNGDGFINILDTINIDFPAPENDSAADFRVLSGEWLISNSTDLFNAFDVDGNGILDNNDDYNFGPGFNFSIINASLYLDANGDGNFEESLLDPPGFSTGHADELAVNRAGLMWVNSDFSGDGADVFAQYAAQGTKDAGTVVYVIAYDVADSQDAVLLQSMATSPDTYFGGGPDEIGEILDEILTDICNIQISKTLITDDPVRAGDPVQFEITVTNTGSPPVTGVHVADTYDTNKLQFLSAVPAPDSTTDDGTLDWSNLAHMPADADPTVWQTGKTRTITVNFIAEDGPDITENCASVDAVLQSDDNVTLEAGPECAKVIIEVPQPGTIEVCKDVVPNDSGLTSWNFTVTGPTPGAVNGLNDAECDTLINRQPGQYTVAETTQAGYTTTVNCGPNGSDTDHNITFTLAEGENASCTFTNTSTASVQVCKDVVPNDGTTWNFALTGPTPGNSPALGDGQCHTFGNRTPGSYTLAETTQAGYTTSVNCGANGSDVDGAITFALSPGEQAICTFTNTKLGSIQVCKEVVPPDATAWNFTVSGPTPGNINGLGDGQCQTLPNRALGSYTVTETAQAGYVGSVNCGPNGSNATNSITFTLDAGENASCTFTNTKQGTIQVCKEIVPPDTTTWNFTVSGPTPGNVNGLGDGQCQSLSDRAAGSYTITEAAQSGYATSVDCGPNGSNATNSITFTLDDGESATCTFTNTKLGTIQVCKEVVPPDATTWDFTVTGPTPGSAGPLGDGQCQTLTDRAAGSYTVTETTQAGFDTTVNCGQNGSDTDNAITFTLDNGENASCTFTNTKRGAIEVCKDVVPNDSGATQWDFAVSGPSGGPVSDLADGECQTLASQIPGSYMISETVQGTHTTTVNCGANGSDTDSDVSFTLDPGEAVSCTFTNTLITISGQFIVNKDFIPNSDAEVTIDLTCSSGAVTDVDPTASESDAANFNVTGALPGATCTATETVPPDYTPDQSDCVDVPLTVGTCTIVNTLNATPTPTPSPTPTEVVFTETPKPTPTETPKPTPTETTPATPTPKETPVPTPGGSETPPPGSGTPPASGTPVVTATPAPSGTPGPSETAEPSGTPGGPTPTPTETPPPTPTPHESFTPPPSNIGSPTPVPSHGPTPTDQATPTALPATATPVPTPTPSPTALPAVFPPTGGSAGISGSSFAFVMLALAGFAVLGGLGLLGLGLGLRRVDG